MVEVCPISTSRLVAVSTSDEVVQQKVEALLSSFASSIVSLRSIVATGGVRWDSEIFNAGDTIAVIDVSTLEEASEEIERIGALAKRAQMIVLARCDVSALEALKGRVAAILPMASMDTVLLSVAQLSLSGFSVFQTSSSCDEELSRTEDGSDQEMERLRSLSQTESRVLLSLTEGNSNKHIANEIGISDNTVRVHMRTIFLKLGVQNRTQAALLATRFRFSGILVDKVESFQAARRSRNGGCQTPIAVD